MTSAQPHKTSSPSQPLLGCDAKIIAAKETNQQSNFVAKKS